MSDVLARVTHELRNQLHALGGLAELASSPSLTLSQRQLVEAAIRQTRQLEYLADELHDFARIEAGFVEPVLQAAWVRQIVADSESIASSMAGPDVAVSSHTDDDVPDVVVLDAGRVRQVVANLVSNAAKYTTSGHIRIGLARCRIDGRPGLRWTVDDSGRGIDAADLERIFEPFNQGSGADRSSGTGLGLAITDRVVRSLGGTIVVTSEVGVGSRFVVDVPVEHTDAAPDDAADASLFCRRGTEVLVVEDNTVNQTLIAEQLHRLGARATIVGTGEAALEALESDHRFGCVLLDWQLPGIDGLETARRYAARAGGTRAPVIGMTAGGPLVDVDAAHEAGMHVVITKPVTLRKLGEALFPFVGERRSQVRDERDPAIGAADTAALDRLADDLGSTAPVRSIVATYLSELERRGAAIAEALAESDEDLLRRTAHGLRSTSRTLGANELDAISEQLEHRSFPPDERLVVAFHQAADATSLDLLRWLETNAEERGT